MPGICESDERQVLAFDGAVRDAARGVSELIANGLASPVRAKQEEGHVEHLQKDLERYLESNVHVVSFLDSLIELDGELRKLYFTGLVRDPEAASSILTMLRVCLALVPWVEERFAYYERHGIVVGDSLGELRKSAEKARALVQNWRAPALSAGPSFRHVHLTAEEAARFRDRHPGAAGA